MEKFLKQQKGEFVKFSAPNGKDKLRCKATGHELNSVDECKRYITGRAYKKAQRQKALAKYDFTVHEPHIKEHKEGAHLMFCTRTKVTLMKDPTAVTNHVNSAKFKRAKDAWQVKRDFWVESEKKKKAAEEVRKEKSLANKEARAAKVAAAADKAANGEESDSEEEEEEATEPSAAPSNFVLSELEAQIMGYGDSDDEGQEIDLGKFGEDEQEPRTRATQSGKAQAKKGKANTKAAAAAAADAKPKTKAVKRKASEETTTTTASKKKKKKKVAKTADDGATEKVVKKKKTKRGKLSKETS